MIDPPITTLMENSSMPRAILKLVAMTADIGLSTAAVTADTFLIHMVLKTQHPIVQTKAKKSKTRTWFHAKENVSPFSKGRA